MLVDNEEIFVLDHHDDASKRLIYAPLRSLLCLVRAEVADVLTAEAPSAIKNSFYRSLKARPILDVRTIISNLQTANPELSLAITDNCTLRCRYCHASAGEEHKQETMSREMIDAVLAKYFECLKPSKTAKISFDGGGEPTYHFPTLQYAVAKAKALAAMHDRDCSFSMATNGFYGDGVRQFILEEFSHISLSFDGPALIQDRHRPAPNGQGSFAVVYETARYFYNSKLSFAFRATVSDYSLEYLTDVYDFFAEHFPGKSLGLEHLNPLGRGATCTTLLPPDKKEFARRLVALIGYANGKSISVVNSASTEYDLIRPVFCSNVGIPNWTVNIAGDVLACARDNVPDAFVFGHFDASTNTLSIDEGKLAQLRQMVVLNYGECSDCFCKFHCAGDCPDRRMTERTDCEFIRGVGLFVLNDKIKGKEVPYVNAVNVATSL